MKKITLSILLVCTAITVFAGKIEKSLLEFDQVEFTGNYKIEMVRADSNYITVINKDDKVVDSDIMIDIENKTLKMSIKQDIYVERNIKVKLFYKDVDHITARRAAQIKCDKISGDRVSVNATTGGKVEVEVSAGHLELSIKSGGSVRAKGSAKTAHYDVNTGGVVAAVNVEVPAVEASIQLGGEIILKASETLDIKIKAGGTVAYKGTATIKSQSIKLGGTIEKLDD